MGASISAYLYLIAAIMFIMALRGLSSPETARQGNLYGIGGMAIAIITTLSMPSVVSYGLILAGIVIGGGIGALIAWRIQMTALPQLVAAFHSLVGLAACAVAAAAFYNPAPYGIGSFGNIAMGSLIEMSLGLAIGALTFTGSIIAFGKLQGLISGKPVSFRGQHLINATLGVVLVGLVAWLAVSNSPLAFWLVFGVALLAGVLIIIPIGGRICPW